MAAVGDTRVVEDLVADRALLLVGDGLAQLLDKRLALLRGQRVDGDSVARLLGSIVALQLAEVAHRYQVC